MLAAIAGSQAQRKNGAQQQRRYRLSPSASKDSLHKGIAYANSGDYVA